jgi:16S rRNA (cytidine1402-2'-O)-methyltransferase
LSVLIRDVFEMGSDAASFHKIYVVATPIGHLDDLSLRAQETLRKVAVIAAEDTRVSRPLLERIGTQARLISVHEHNEAAAVEQLAKILLHDDVALICDAGTPSISDPGSRLIAGLARLGVQAIPVPGPSAVSAIMSVAGLGDGRFRFEGFLPARSKGRTERLKLLARSEVTLVFFESPHRITDFADDLAAVIEADRDIVVGRELTKRFEQIARLKVSELSDWLNESENHQRGEFVIALAPYQAPAPDTSAERELGLDDLGSLSIDPKQLLTALCEGLPASKAAKWAAKLSGRKDVDWYTLAGDYKRL